jgi:hypothetical protein
MNARTKLVAAVAAGLVAGATLMGAAYAAPKALTNPAVTGYRMMGSALTSVTAGIPTWTEMQSFMNRYRAPSGAIDMNRMHSDVTTGKVTPPCLGGRSGTSGSSATPSALAAPRTGYGMMGYSH